MIHPKYTVVSFPGRVSLHVVKATVMGKNANETQNNLSRFHTVCGLPCPAATITKAGDGAPMCSICAAAILNEGGGTTGKQG